MLISNIKYFKQKDPQHCAPTVASMVLSKLGVSVTQEQIADIIMKRNNAGIRLAFTLDMCGYLTQYGIYTICYANFPDSMSWDILISNIKNDNPVMVSQRYSEKTHMGHYRVVLGIHTAGKNQAEIIVYHDPIDGAYQEVKKETFMERWKPGNDPSMVIKNEIIIIQKTKPSFNTQMCSACGGRYIATNIDFFDNRRGFEFINPNVKINAKSIGFRCEMCGSQISHFGPSL